MHKLGELELVPVWLNKAHRVGTARLLLAGHHLRAIGVLEGDRLVGMVTLAATQMADEEAAVETIMSPIRHELPASMLVQKAAQFFIDEDIDIAPVMDEGNFLGVLTSHHLLKELRRSWDPLTNLGWSDRLREWGAQNLAAGREITIIFIDIDKFGEYNKRYGHTVGDDVLRRISGLLKEVVDRRTDILVRYGGDEFALGTLRNRVDAERLAAYLKSESADLFVREVDHPVTFSVGIAGGRRTKERLNVHYASTVDELINKASKDCLAQKKGPNLTIDYPHAGGDTPEDSFRPGRS